MVMPVVLMMMVVLMRVMVAMMPAVPAGRVRQADTCEQQNPGRNCKYSAHDEFSYPLLNCTQAHSIALVGACRESKREAARRFFGRSRLPRLLRNTDCIDKETEGVSYKLIKKFEGCSGCRVEHGLTTGWGDRRCAGSRDASARERCRARCGAGA